MTELWQMGALELARNIRSKQVSSREVIEAHLSRVNDVNGDLNAIVRVLGDEARAAADDADRAVLDGRHLGRLHGVPCTVKENIDLAGTPTTSGVRVLADAIAPVDSPTVARMRAAGAIPFARTNLPDLGLRVHTDSDLHGLTRNPWDPNVTAGGSSGGEASAIASGMSPIGLGNDIGGSLRNPAHCCGIASLKPTAGVIPMATVIPPVDMLLGSQLMVVEGPMARRVADVRAGLHAIEGPDRRDPRSVPATLTDASAAERFTIAVLTDPPGGSTDPGISSATRAVADRLHDAGHRVVDATPPDYETVIELWIAVLIADIRASRAELDAVLGEGGRASIAAFDAISPPTTFPEVQLMHAERFRVMRSWSEFFEGHQILLSPTWAQPAFEHGADLDPDIGFEMIRDTIRPVVHANLLGTPAAVTPAGLSDGLPVGVQLMGDRFTDLRCLTVAAEIESLMGTLTPIDPITACEPTPMTPRLVAIDRPGGPDFAEQLQRVWAAGDAAFPVDQRLPATAKEALCAVMRVGAAVEPGDALVVATSGTGGEPKGVVLTHDSVAASAEATSKRLAVSADDHWLACLPLSHVGGLSVVTRALHTGTTLTVLPGFDAAAVQSSGATLVSLVAATLPRVDHRLFRAILLGGGRPPSDRPANAITTYGMTETGSGVVYDGVPLEGVDVRIDSDGDIWLRGPMLLRSYRDGRDPKDAGRWFPTGDVGVWLADGRLHVEGRRGDLIISGGENVWPEAVERALTDHPGVGEVMVRGVDDAAWGQIVEAVVVAGDSVPTLESLREHVKRQHPPFMAPRRLVVVDALPRTSLGKVRRV